MTHLFTKTVISIVTTTALGLAIAITTYVFVENHEVIGVSDEGEGIGERLE